jgi:hypothetical protein
LFDGRKISRKLYQRIKYGNWRDLSDEQIHKKIDYVVERKEKIKGFEIIYEETLKLPLGQYCLGIAQEKIANGLIKFANNIKNEGRRLVRKHQEKVRCKQEEKKRTDIGRGEQ